MKIGITERGDPSIDYSWVKKMDKVDGAIIITKNLTDKLIEEAIPYMYKLIFHVSCTGYGQTVVEPNIPEYTHQLSQALKVLRMMSSESVVIRIDPIIPTYKGLKRAKKVFETAYKLGFRRFRVSLMDAYPHVRERFKALEKEYSLENDSCLPYGDRFSPTPEQIKAANDLFKEMKDKYSDISIESCAEKDLTETERIGCVSEKDLKILGLDMKNVDSVGYQRKGCLCCSAKTELLSNKKQCPYKCLYCYWKN